MTQINRRKFLETAAGCMIASAFGSIACGSDNKKLNVLLITADDMNWNTPGCFGGRTPSITPNIDKLASEGVRFERAHVTVAVCMPSRESLMTGRYPQRHGGMGFDPIREDVPTLQESLHEAGYLNGILGKASHLMPASKFKWDMCRDQRDLGQGRSPDIYYNYTKSFIEQASREGKPFFLMANSHDPHRPFCGSAQENKIKNSGFPSPSRVYKSDEIEVPGFLPDLPDIRTELAQYYSSSRRCDDTVGAVLKALRDTGEDKNTLVMFLSDNGMSIPFAKTNCYLNSTRTPWIVRWLGKVKPGSVDRDHFISGADFMPTILEAVGIKQVDGMDGRSFLPLLSGRDQQGRDKVFTMFHETSAREIYPMRCVQNSRFGYIFNAWADGKRVFKNESQAGLTMKAMDKAAQSDPKIAERVKLFKFRVTEELYDFEKDPDALNNLAEDPKYKEELKSLRKQLLEWMEQIKDPLLDDYRRQVWIAG